MIVRIFHCALFTAQSKAVPHILKIFRPFPLPPNGRNKVSVEFFAPPLYYQNIELSPNPPFLETEK
jgi:hypothetical protein